MNPRLKTVNLKSDWPTVQKALERLDHDLVMARKENCTLLKLIHGFGSTGVGGDIRVAVQKRLWELVEAGELRGCIYGENWTKADPDTWRLLQTWAELKNDPDLGRRNRGITVVML